MLTNMINDIKCIILQYIHLKCYYNILILYVHILSYIIIITINTLHFQRIHLC